MKLKLEREDFSIGNRRGEVVGGIHLDPQNLSFDNGLQFLVDTVFSFDLDCDGCAEKIAGLRQGGGFLGIDLNRDNRFNDGGELFSPRTGCAFNKLQAYDEDGNNWLDESDPVFAKLVSG